MTRIHNICETVRIKLVSIKEGVPRHKEFQQFDINIYSENIISVLTTMRCCLHISAATVPTMDTTPHITTPAFTTKSGTKVWTDQSREEEKFRNQFWKMVTIPFLEGVLLNPVMAQARKIWGLNHLRHKKNIKLTSTFFGKSCCWYPNLYLSGERRTSLFTQL